MKYTLLIAIVISLFVVIAPAPAKAVIFAFDVIPNRNITQGESWGLAGFADEGQSRFTVNGQIIEPSKFPYGATVVFGKDLPVGVNITLCFEVSKAKSSWHTTESSCKIFQVQASTSTPAATATTVPNQGKCPSAQATLVIGKQAKIAGPGDTEKSDDKPLYLRAKPTQASKLLAKMPASAKDQPSIVDVIGGPVCAEGFRWYQVKFTDKTKAQPEVLTGWAAEVGPAGLYNLLPLTSENAK